MKITDLQGYSVVKPVATANRPQETQSVEQPKQNPLLRFANGVTNFVGARGIADQYGASLARFQLRRSGNEEAQKYVQDPGLKKVVGSALQTGAMFIPTAGPTANLATKMAVGAGTGYMIDVGSDLQKNKPVLESAVPGVATVVGGVTPFIVDKVSKIVNKLPKELEKANLRLTPTEQQQLKRQGKDIADFLAKKKIVGTPEQRLKEVDKLYYKFEKALDAKLDGSDVVFMKEELIDALDDIPKQFADDPVALTEVTRKVNSAKAYIDDISGVAVTVSRINNIKRSYFKRAYGKNQTDVVSDAYHALGSAFKQLMDEQVPGLNKFNQQYSNVILARKLLNKAATRNQSGLIMRGIGATVGGTVGNSVAGPGGAAAGAILGDQVANRAATPVRSAVGAGIQSVIDLVEKLPVDTAGNISKKALLQLLANSQE